MRSAAIIFGAAIAARIALTPVYYLIVEPDDGAPAAPVSLLSGSLEDCEKTLLAITAQAHCEGMTGAWHLMHSASIAVDSLERIVREALQPVGDAQEAAIGAVQDAAAGAVQDAALDALQDAIVGEDDAPVE